MLEVVITVNDIVIRRVAIYNRGPVGGVYENGDHPTGGGPRHYEYESGHLAGEVIHARREGADVLVASVLDEIANHPLR